MNEISILDFIFKNKKIEIKEEKHEKKVNSFRPTKFDEYIGQEKAKEILSKYIIGVKQRELIFPHTMIHGSTGTGKSTLAKIIANELNVNFSEIVASGIKKEFEILSYLEKINGGILFLDEIHSLERKIAEKFYPLMEYFRYRDNDLKPFTLIGATTELGEILKDRKPLYDRFKISIELEEYLKTDLIKISQQYATKTFPDEKISEEIHEIIASNSRNTPRTLIRLLEATVYFNGNIKSVMKNFGIIKEGITLKDLKILKYIASNKSGVGLQGLTNYLDTSNENYIYQIEPFLLKNDLIVRTDRGRKITLKGINLIKELKNAY